MKKILCFIFSLLLLFNSTVVYADIHGGSSGDLVTPTPTPLIPEDMLDENGRLKPPASLQFLDKILVAGLAGNVSSELASLLYGFIGDDFLKNYDNSDNSISLENGGSTVHFHDTFVDKFNTALQDKVHALDGYYIIEPLNKNSPDKIAENRGIKNGSDDYKKLMGFYDSARLATCYGSKLYGSQYIYYQDFYYYLIYDGRKYSTSSYDPSTGDYVKIGKNATDKGLMISFNNSTPYMENIVSGAGFSIDYDYKTSLSNSLNYIASHCWGFPFKLFYSKQAVINYIDKGRTYVPQLPSGGFKVNIKYINNTTNLPDITYNITTENKTETEIQNQYDTTINNYLNGLDDFTDGGGGTTNPTPTPSGGGSGGDFGDGTTPTPKPDFTDGSLTDTNTLLQKILDKLTEFSANHDKLAKTITDYIEKNDGKLEEILLAIQALSDGKTETEQNGCKYDFTALSKYLTDLWNNSDKKFDEMVKLLEENNKYQQKLVDSLNEIKALLIADTVMDFFKDRSQETAEKAKDKFPTSIPWDVSLVLNSMSAEPKNPKFSLPIKIESFKINETIDIDLSTGEWEKLAKTCRYILSVTFILFLIHLSRKLFSNGGDD